MESLHEAARAGDTVKLVSLLAQGQKVDGRDKHSRTALHMAAWAGQAKAVETLLAYRANLKATAMDDMNALHFAAQKGHTDTSEILIQHGLPVKTQMRKGQTALHIAASKGHIDLVKLLLEKKADPTTTNRKQQSSIDIAANDDIRQVLQDAVAKAQERLERIKAAGKKTDNSEARQNVRKRPQEGDHDAEVNGQQKEPQRKRATVALSHLEDEEE